MDRLTAVRTFARPGYTPAKRTRIQATKWYTVTMQNIDRDPRCDYIGLGEGEYTELVTGTDARARRDAHLNHCNAIAEYSGPLYRLTEYRYGHVWEPIKYVGTEGDIGLLRQALTTEETRVKAEIDRYRVKLLASAATEDATHKEHAAYDREAAEESAQLLAAWTPWRIESERIR